MSSDTFEADDESKKSMMDESFSSSGQDDSLSEIQNRMMADLDESISVVSHMEKENLDEQLSAVQNMVHEMKESFFTVMEELSSIQGYDQTLQKQMHENQSENQKEIVKLSDTVSSLKEEVNCLSEQLGNVLKSQNSIEERLNNAAREKESLLAELVKSGAISNKTRARLSRSDDENLEPEGVDVFKDVKRTSNQLKTTRIKSYLASLSDNEVLGMDGNRSDSDSSAVATANRSLQLSHLLQQKCMNMSESSEDELSLKDKAITKGKTVQGMSAEREKTLYDLLESERQYCANLWKIIDQYYGPLEEEEILNLGELRNIFPSYLQSLYEQHSSIQRKLLERISETKWNGIVGDIVASISDNHKGKILSFYKEYISDVPNMMTALNSCISKSSKFRQFLKINHRSANTELTNLLLEPLSRIPNYIFFIKELQSVTNDNHPDCFYLNESLMKLKQFLDVMNGEIDNAMQLINTGRSNECSTSLVSSGSSCDDKPVPSARDSGIHSNGEDTKSSPSPQIDDLEYRQVYMRGHVPDSRHEFSDFQKQTAPNHPNFMADPRQNSRSRLYEVPPPMNTALPNPVISLPRKRTNEKVRKIKIRRRGEPHLPQDAVSYRSVSPAVSYGNMFGYQTHQDFYETGVHRDGRYRPQSAMEFLRPGSSMDYAYPPDVYYDSLDDMHTLPYSSAAKMHLHQRQMMHHANIQPPYKNNLEVHCSTPRDIDKPYTQTFNENVANILGGRSCGELAIRGEDQEIINRDDYDMYEEDDSSPMVLKVGGNQQRREYINVNNGIYNSLERQTQLSPRGNSSKNNKKRSSSSSVLEKQTLAASLGHSLKKSFEQELPVTVSNEDTVFSERNQLINEQQSVKQELPIESVEDSVSSSEQSSKDDGNKRHMIQLSSLTSESTQEDVDSFIDKIFKEKLHGHCVSPVSLNSLSPKKEQEASSPKNNSPSKQVENNMVFTFDRNFRVKSPTLENSQKGPMKAVHPQSESSFQSVDTHNSPSIKLEQNVAINNKEDTISSPYKSVQMTDQSLTDVEEPDGHKLTDTRLDSTNQNSKVVQSPVVRNGLVPSSKTSKVPIRQQQQHFHNKSVSDIPAVERHSNNILKHNQVPRQSDKNHVVDKKGKSRLHPDPIMKALSKSSDDVRAPSPRKLGLRNSIKSLFSRKRKPVSFDEFSSSSDMTDIPEGEATSDKKPWRSKSIPTLTDPQLYDHTVEFSDV